MNEGREGKAPFRGYSSPNYTPVPDELFDEQLPDLSGAELKVLLYVIRRTFGFKRESDNISLSQMLNGLRTRDGRVLDRGVGLSKKTLLQAIKSLGVPIALDDFGTGYSSFSYLHRFPIDTLKIDRSFIHNIGTAENHTELVAAIIAMAHILNLRVIAEGIETGKQMEILAEKQCDIVQGYLLAHPLPAERVAEILRRGFLRTA